MHKRYRRIIAVLLAMALVGLITVVAVRGTGSKTLNDKVRVAVTYYPLYDFARNVGGDKVSVVNITPAGSEPHDYEPTPQQLVEAQKANVFVYNGAGMEQWVPKFLPDFSHTVVKASSSIALRQGRAENGSVSTDIKDPHFWLDPVLAQQMVNNIRDGLSKADPADSAYFAARAKRYNAKLAALDREYRQATTGCSLRTIITSHAAFGYLAARYNVDVVSIAGASPDEEPSTSKLAELSQLVKDKRISYVFFESLVSPKMADTIAKEAGAKTAVLDPIEGISESDQQQGKDYISAQRQNIQNLKLALGCK